MGRGKKGAAPKKNEDKLQAAEKLKEQGNESVKNGNIEKAIQQYSEAIELSPENHIFWNNRSLAHFVNESYEQSLKDAEQSIECNKQYTKAYIRKALALLEMDRLDEAILSIQENEQNVENTEDLAEIKEKLQTEWKKWNVLSQDDNEIKVHNKMLQWLKDGHADFSKLKMQFYEKNYRGVHAAKKIYNKQTILYIPKSHLITLEMAKDTIVGKKIIAANIDLLSPKHSFLSTILLQEKNKKNSKWKIYLDILPSDYNQFPIFYSEEDLSWIDGSPFQAQVRDKKQDILKDYNDICGVAEEFKKYTFESFCWARMTASSRIFGLNIDGIKTDAFVPLADMLNHKRPKQTSWSYSDELGGFVIESLEDIERGNQIYDSYGRKCNSRFLLNYGFIVLNNDANEVAIRVEFDRNDPTLKLKQEIMREDTEFKTFRITENYEEQNNQEFFGYIRYTCLKDQEKILILNNLHEQHQMQEEYQNHRNINKGYRPQKTPPISVENEIQMWKKAILLCELQQGRYKTTLDQDYEILKQQDLTTNQRNCVLLRSGEKEILKENIKMGKKMLQLLQLSRKEVQSLSLKPEYIKYANYISKILIGQLNLKQK